MQEKYDEALRQLDTYKLTISPTIDQDSEEEVKKKKEITLKKISR